MRRGAVGRPPSPVLREGPLSWFTGAVADVTPLMTRVITPAGRPAAAEGCRSAGAGRARSRAARPDACRWRWGGGVGEGKGGRGVGCGVGWRGRAGFIVRGDGGVAVRSGVGWCGMRK